MEVYGRNICVVSHRAQYLRAIDLCTHQSLLLRWWHEGLHARLGLLASEPLTVVDHGDPWQVSEETKEAHGVQVRDRCLLGQGGGAGVLGPVLGRLSTVLKRQER